ncbi:potassium channel family protein [Aporhodopirellula aestuarii]|uniref:Potassium channel protein n=1 Tax=Aporhodopirellula aestuarii TaxID=2950107 RepID=A0ABT0TYR8_9BACT|nr:potassium channel protein [Aporhodopirellula aestuarii]MCM2369710.1 potassium channel protein [Aporhodopirellula aestuarii]
MRANSSKTPLQRTAHGGVLLFFVFVIAVAGYQILGNYGLLEAVWMVVITISTVGYSEASSLSPTLQVFTVLVILVGMSAAAYTFGGLIQLLLAGEIDRLIGLRRMTAEIATMKDHIIICGFGRMGQSLAVDLRSQGKTVVIIELDADRIREADILEFACLTGDATEEGTLESVGIVRAGTLVAALSGDAENVFLTLTARNLNPEIQIVARADQRSSEKKLRQAGANRVVMPTVVGSRQMSRFITRPTTADVIELVSQRDFADLELDEVFVSETNALAGLTVSATDAHRENKLLIIAIQTGEGKLLFNPVATHKIQTGDTLIVMGHLCDIRSFRERFVQSDDLKGQKDPNCRGAES